MPGFSWFASSYFILASATGSACPWCLIMFDDAVKFHNLDDAVQAKDIAELVAESL